ncbi:MAG TPA: hypothetical protein VJ919_10055 [Tangfeifania sp.]|nr:hypothetical protein [Tangfeifania sp.]
MRSSVFFKVLMALAIVFSLQSCNDDEDVKQEFIADDDSFSNFMNWELEETNQGPDPALGAAHAGNDETVTRKIYYKEGQEPVNGQFPVGTIIVKHSSNPDQSVNEFTAMVKRGNDFSPDGGDWEWFMLNTNGSIATDASSGMKMRGANLMNGMCLSCHSAGSTDFTFTK